MMLWCGLGGCCCYLLFSSWLCSFVFGVGCICDVVLFVVRMQLVVLVVLCLFSGGFYYLVVRYGYCLFSRCCLIVLICVYSCVFYDL